MTHDYALRTPWYDLARAERDPFDDTATMPAIQKYAATDYVDRLMRDPSVSLAFGPEDEWSYPVSMASHPRLHKGYPPYRMVRTGMRKLYQPHHDRFYALVAELFCDEPGLPRPGDTEGLEVGFVVRRDVMVVQGKRNLTALRKLARLLIKELDSEQRGQAKEAPDQPDVADIDQVTWTTAGRQLPPDQAVLLAAANPEWVTEAWIVGEDGRGTWTKVPTQPDAAPQLLPHEQEFSMWRIPPRPQDCAAAQTRSLWFGAVPTMSAHPDATGAPKLDDQSVYRMQCFARLPPRPGHEHCPPRFWWSTPTAPYRLASFFDPTGTQNRRVSITTPDFRTLAARAGNLPAGPGGVEFIQPPGSQLQFTKGKGIPDTGTSGGDAVERCTYALELFTIVAMFLFTLFLPIVTLIFQLWWMLLLRFCWPSAGAALKVVNDYLATGNPINQMSANEKDSMDEVLGPAGSTDLLVSNIRELGSDSQVAKMLVDSLQPGSLPSFPSPPRLPKPGDPLCRKGPGFQAAGRSSDRT